MTTYYYDEEARALIAVNEDTNEVRLLEPLRLDDETEHPAKQFSDQQLFPKRKYKKRETDTPSRAKGTGCPECGSPSRHRKDCSRAAVPKAPMLGNKEWERLEDTSRTRPNAMTRMEYGRVRIASSHDIPHETIANNLSLTETEVSKASDAETYDDYLKS